MVDNVDDLTWLMMRMSDDKGPRDGFLRRNRDDERFVGTVDRLTQAVYGEIGGILVVKSPKDIFTAWTIKVMYLDDGIDNPQVILHIGEVLTKFSVDSVVPHEVARVIGSEKPFSQIYPSDLAQRIDYENTQTRMEVCRFLGDRSLYTAGVYPMAVSKSRLPIENELGRTCYSRLSQCGQFGREMTRMFSELAERFGEYVEEVRKIRDGFILQPNRGIVEGKMLEALSNHRETNDERYIREAERYAKVLNHNLTPKGK